MTFQILIKLSSLSCFPTHRPYPAFQLIISSSFQFNQLALCISCELTHSSPDDRVTRFDTGTKSAKAVDLAFTTGFSNALALATSRAA